MNSAIAVTTGSLGGQHGGGHSGSGSNGDQHKQESASGSATVTQASHDSSAAMTAAATAANTPAPQAVAATGTVTTTTPAQTEFSTPQDQIVSVVAPLRTAADGTYTLSLQLHPADLGEITLHVQMHDGEMSVHIESAEAQTRDTLTAAIGQLRSAIAITGIKAGDIDVGSRSAQQQPQQQMSSNSGSGQQGQHTGGHGFDQHGDSRQPGQAFSGQPGWSDQSATNTGHPGTPAGWQPATAPDLFETDVGSIPSVSAGATNSTIGNPTLNVLM